MKRYFALLILLAFMSSCSLVTTVAKKTTGTVIAQGSDEMMTEANWEFFGQATPANLKLIEGLWYSDQENKELMTLLIKGYAGYAFGYAETKALKSILQEKKDHDYQQTIWFYNKVIFYGKKYLELNGIKLSDFEQSSFAAKIKTLFNDKFSKEDEIAIFYFAQSLASSINLQRSNVQKLSFFSHAKNMMEWVCERSPSIENGSCNLFNAILKASTPRMMGGDPIKAAEMFQTFIQKQPYNLLARLSYIQFYLIPMMEEDDFYDEMKALKAEILVWDQFVNGHMGKNSEKYSKHRNFNLFNSIAKKRYEQLFQIKKVLF